MVYLDCTAKAELDDSTRYSGYWKSSSWCKKLNWSVWSHQVKMDLALHRRLLVNVKGTHLSKNSSRLKARMKTMVGCTPRANKAVHIREHTRICLYRNHLSSHHLGRSKSITRKHNGIDSDYRNDIADDDEVVRLEVWRTIASAIIRRRDKVPTQNFKFKFWISNCGSSLSLPYLFWIIEGSFLDRTEYSL